MKIKIKIKDLEINIDDDLFRRLFKKQVVKIVIGLVVQCVATQSGHADINWKIFVLFVTAKVITELSKFFLIIIRKI